jgi:hypothetical protein
MSAILPNLYLAIGAGWLAAVGFSLVVAQIPGLNEISGMKVLRELGSLPAKPIAWYPVGVYAASAILTVVVGAYVAEYRSQLEA